MIGWSVSFTSTETLRLIRTGSPGRPSRLSHISWTLPPAGGEGVCTLKDSNPLPTLPGFSVPASTSSGTTRLQTSLTNERTTYHRLLCVFSGSAGKSLSLSTPPPPPHPISFSTRPPHLPARRETIAPVKDAKALNYDPCKIKFSSSSSPSLSHTHTHTARCEQLALEHQRTGTLLLQGPPTSVTIRGNIRTRALEMRREVVARTLERRWKQLWHLRTDAKSN